MTHAKALTEAKLVAGNLALDFVNTSTSRNVTEHVWVDYMTDAFEVMIWLRFSQAIEEQRFREITAIIANDEVHESDFYQLCLMFRSALSRIFLAVVENRVPEAEDVALLNGILAEAYGAKTLVWTDDGPKIGQSIPNRSGLNDTLWPIAYAAEEVLINGRLQRIKRCASSTCDWLFYDESKNGTRQWCQMEVCGNREKGRRRLSRERNSSSSGIVHHVHTSSPSSSEYYEEIGTIVIV